MKHLLMNTHNYFQLDKELHTHTHTIIFLVSQFSIISHGRTTIQANRDSV